MGSGPENSGQLTTKSASEFSPQRLAQAFGIPIVWAGNADNHYGYGELMTAGWSGGFQVDKSRKDGPGFEFGFIPVSPESPVSMTGICQIDFDRFTGELEAMGFARGTQYDTLPPAPPTGWPSDMRGRRMFDIFERPSVANGLRIEVYPEGEADEPSEKVTHLCVKQVLIY